MSQTLEASPPQELEVVKSEMDVVDGILLQEDHKTLSLVLKTLLSLGGLKRPNGRDACLISRLAQARHEFLNHVLFDNVCQIHHSAL